VRTLVISDLHLGSRLRHDVLRLPAPRERLLSALDGIDRLVLLGDTVELLTRHPERSMHAAEPIIRALGQRMGADREVIVVPGNHDRSLVRAWVRAQGSRLVLPDAIVDPDATPALSRLLSWLAPARTQARYPGLWLDDRIWATHGHYLDTHLIPESSIGMLRGRSRRNAPVACVPVQRYETRRRRGRAAGDSLGARLLARPVGTTLETIAELVRAPLPHLPGLLMKARLTSVTATLLDVQMRHAAVPAIVRVANRLGIEADWIVFGHVHRRGPLAGEEWAAQAGGVRVANPGSWLYEPLLLDRATPPHPYWPGGAVVIEPGREPRTVGLLDDFGSAALRTETAKR
jgi:UDP-2,3-diacylglucosamine pyrophosphatase LpxH